MITRRKRWFLSVAGSLVLMSIGIWVVTFLVGGWPPLLGFFPELLASVPTLFEIAMYTTVLSAVGVGAYYGAWKPVEQNALTGGRLKFLAPWFRRRLAQQRLRINRRNATKLLTVFTGDEKREKEERLSQLQCILEHMLGRREPLLRARDAAIESSNASITMPLTERADRATTRSSALQINPKTRLREAKRDYDENEQHIALVEELIQELGVVYAILVNKRSGPEESLRDLLVVGSDRPSSADPTLEAELLHLEGMVDRYLNAYHFVEGVTGHLKIVGYDQEAGRRAREEVEDADIRRRAMAVAAKAQQNNVQ